MKINSERLAQTFTQLCETDSPSRQEGRMATLLTEMLCALDAKPPFEDDSAAQTGSQCGNLFFRDKCPDHLNSDFLSVFKYSEITRQLKESRT